MSVERIIEDAVRLEAENEELRVCLHLAHAAALQGGYTPGSDRPTIDRVRLALGAKSIFAAPSPARTSDDG
jgi:hypothetical protein